MRDKNKAVINNDPIIYIEMYNTDGPSFLLTMPYGNDNITKEVVCEIQDVRKSYGIVCEIPVISKINRAVKELKEVYGIMKTHFPLADETGKL